MNTFARISMNYVLGYVYCLYFWETLYYVPDECKLVWKKSPPSLGPGYYFGALH